ncbi:hypothetical protein [Paraburkholderia hayleyella]|nr:hypothetical protein [Paraburkholderia hayleyella]
MTEAEPLARYAWAAAFFMVSGRSFIRSCAFVKEPIETQANWHF